MPNTTRKDGAGFRRRMPHPLSTIDLRRQTFYCFP